MQFDKLIEKILLEADPKKGTGKKPKGSGRRLYTDENPKDTVSVKFSTVKDIRDTLNKRSFKSKSHARQSQIINLIHQRVRAAVKRVKDPQKKKNLKAAFKYITKKKEASKKKTQRLNENRVNDTDISNKALIVKDGRILLLKNKGNEYELPGGHLQKGEMILQGLKREVQEELGLDYDNRPQLKISKPNRNIFKIDISSDKLSKIKLSDEHIEYIMCPLNDCFKLNLSDKCKKDLESIFFNEENSDIHKPVRPGILKNRLGKLSCTKVRKAKSKLKNKGTNFGKALQRYLNYHC
jgi:hypothetical protein